MEKKKIDEFNLVEKAKTWHAEQRRKKKEMQDCLAVMWGTDTGRKFITHLIVTSQCLQNSRSGMAQMQVSSDYFNAWADFGRNILSFMTAEQISELIVNTQPKEDTDD